jgi:hypothetical protein
MVIPIDSDHVPDLYSIRGQEIGKGIDNKTLNRQLQTPRVIVLFRGVQEQEFFGRIGYIKEEFSFWRFATRCWSLSSSFCKTLSK